MRGRPTRRQSDRSRRSVLPCAEITRDQSLQSRDVRQIDLLKSESVSRGKLKVDGDMIVSSVEISNPPTSAHMDQRPYNAAQPERLERAARKSDAFCDQREPCPAAAVHPSVGDRWHEARIDTDERIKIREE